MIDISPLKFVEGGFVTVSAITILMPSISKGQLLDAIATVQNQTNPNWKLLVGGDGHIPLVEIDDPRIDVIGIPATREAGLMRNKLSRLASTEWIGFLDDDDELHPDYVRV